MAEKSGRECSGPRHYYKRAWLFRKWSKMVFIPLSVFAPVPNFHSEFKLQGLAQTRKTELKPFLANLGTHLRAFKR
jgi:hypothetical protein